MKTQKSLLDEKYLELRLNEIPKIRNKEIAFAIHKSNRETSKSLYVSFYYPKGVNKGLKGVQLRVSDHFLNVYSDFDLVVANGAVSSSKEKERFIKLVNLAIKKTEKKYLYCELYKISKEK